MASLLHQGMGMAEYARLFAAKATSEGVPLSGSIDLTNRCNLACVHCYLGGRRDCGKSAEMPRERLFALIDELAESGCLFLLLTGGEPLLRPDFPAIYRHARSRGLLVSLFTNGTLINRGFIDLMRELPPNNLEISLYGATAATYEAITSVPGSFARCMAGIGLLARAGIPFTLKTMLMNANRHELPALRRVADELGAPFRMDAGLFPRFDGDRSPVAQRLDPADAVACEFADPDLARRWALYHATHHPAPTDSLYECGAGRNSFHIKADGALVPCLMLEHLRQGLPEGGFLAAWGRLREAISSRIAGPDYPCRGCDDRLLCGICPALFLLETGSEETKSEFICAIGRQRALAIQTTNSVGGAGNDGVQ